MIVAGRRLSSRSRDGGRWELTRAALDGLLTRLDTDLLTAAEKYEHLRRALLRFFSWHQGLDAESSVDETLDRVARRLDAGHAIDDVQAFALGVARLVRLERQRQAAAMRTTGDHFHLAEAAASDEATEARDAWLRRCLGRLSPSDRDLIMTYYAGTGRERIDGRARLAAAL